VAGRVRALNVRDIIEAARDLARQSRDLMLPSLRAEAQRMGTLLPNPNKWIVDQVQHRMNLVMDCYLTGCEEMLRRLHGDTTPEHWEEDYDHEACLAELLNEYGLLQSANAGSSQPTNGSREEHQQQKT
jgi:hypothetical protein